MAGSVECSTVTARVAASGSAARWPGRQRMPPRQPGSALAVGDVAHDAILPDRGQGRRAPSTGQPSKQAPSNSYSSAVGPTKKSLTMLTPVGAAGSTLLITLSRKMFSLGSPDRLPASSGSIPS